MGDIPLGVDEPMIKKRPDKDEWMVDGRCMIYDFLAYFDREDLYEPASYTTIGGLVMESLRRVPSEGDAFTWRGFRLEVVDMDRVRIDKISVTFE